MLKLLIPIILASIGLGAGIGAGLVLHDPDTKAHDTASTEKGDDHAAVDDYTEAEDEAEEQVDPDGLDYIKLNNQFVVPLVTDGNVSALVVLSLSLEVRLGNEEVIYGREPKLRDAFLRVLFDHANAGGFSGEFTKSTNMMVLRDSLLEIARKNLGDIVTNVLIVDLVRQDT